MENNIESVLNKLFQLLRIPVTRTSINQAVISHPAYPSISTISDLLDRWAVPSGAFQLKADELNDVPCPYIVLLNSNNGEFAVVTKRKEDEFVIYNEHHKEACVSMNEFNAVFSGTVLMAESDINAGEEGYRSNRLAEIWNYIKIPLVFIAITVLLAVYFPLPFLGNFKILFMFTLKILGLGLTVLLLSEQISSGNAFMQSFCPKTSKIDCNAILSSKAAKLTSFLSWSELGFFYFGGTMLVLCCNSAINSFLPYIGAINLLALPYTIYSIYYQAFIAKKWCLLCCLIQLLFWFEFASLYPAQLSLLNNISLFSAGKFFAQMLIVPVLWETIKPLLVKANEYPQVSAQLKRFKYNEDLFWSRLKSQPKFTLLDRESSLVIGNEDAPHIITIASNPNCSPCAAAHKSLHDLLSTTNFRLQIVFSCPAESTMLKSKVAASVMMIKARRNTDAALMALNDWYMLTKKDLGRWQHRFEISGEPDYGTLKAQHDWCAMSGVEFTPTIFINGYKLSRDYMAEDLKYFL